MIRAAIAIATLLALAGCSLCPEGYEAKSGGGTYGFIECVKETDQ